MSRGGIGNIERSSLAVDPQYSAEGVPEITVLLLGDAEVGKSTFLSRLSLGTTTTGQPAASDSSITLRDPPPPPPPYALPQLRDLDQPFTFHIRLYNRPYRLLFYDTASPTSYLTLQPGLLVLCYDISRRATLASLRARWGPLADARFNADERRPVILLGLKRDLRRAWRDDRPSEEDGAQGGSSVMPEEALRVAQELRCDRYAECSAVTGELCREVVEDVAKTAAKTTTEKGGRTEGGCRVM